MSLGISIQYERADTIASRHATGSHVDLYNGPKDQYPIKIDIEEEASINRLQMKILIREENKKSLLLKLYRF